MPLAVAPLTALRMRSSIFSRSTPSAASLPSEIGLSITDAGDAELDEAVDVCLDRAREAPDLGPQPGGNDQLDRAVVVVGDAGKAGLDAIDARGVERAGDLELLLGREHHPDRLLTVAERRVIEADGHVRLRIERLRVERACPHLRAVECHSAVMPPCDNLSLVGSRLPRAPVCQRASL